LLSNANTAKGNATQAVKNGAEREMKAFEQTSKIMQGAATMAKSVANLGGW